MRTYKLVPKKYCETTAYGFTPINDYLSEENDDLDILENDLGLDREEKFKGPKDAIKWCNEKFNELKDIKYKQIANYLHIYI